jgi:nicotinamidase-related amidase
MQNGIAGRAFNRAKLVENAARLAKAARMARIPVIYSQHTGLPFEYMSDSWRLMMHKRGMDPRKQTFLAEGSKEWEIMDELKPQAGDVVLQKHTASFFVGTPLEPMLRARGTRILILAGVSTEGGVEGTARHAACSGFIPVIAEDAVGSFEEPVHAAMLGIMRRMFEVLPTEAIIANIAAKAAIPLG